MASVYSLLTKMCAKHYSSPHELALRVVVCCTSDFITLSCVKPETDAETPCLTAVDDKYSIVVIFLDKL